MKLKCNFALFNQQGRIAITLNNNGLKNGTHYKCSIFVGSIKR
jgi:hypothetical protein